MNKVISVIVLGVLFCISVSLFLKYDNKRFDYGWDCDFCTQKLPSGLKHTFHSDYPQRFYLLDEDDFELVGSGFRFYDSSFKIKNFFGYGYNDTSVLLKCTDSLNNLKYLISYETKYKNKKGNSEISFKDLSNSNFEQIKDKYHWVVFDEEQAQKATFKRFIALIGALLSLFFIVRNLFGLLRKSKTTQ